jgi:hypothetical protein
MNEENKSIYDLKLHEVLCVKTDDDYVTHIVRVPGGWLYLYGFSKSSVFVPFNNEFQIEKN